MTLVVHSPEKRRMDGAREVCGPPAAVDQVVVLGVLGEGLGDDSLAAGLDSAAGFDSVAGLASAAGAAAPSPAGLSPELEAALGA